ncbi:plasmid replication protein, partial [Clostridium perfringens]|nr:plasmid replication protein [Clostridium perfringens]
KKARPELRTISVKQIRTLINRLADLDLIIIEKVKNRNCYILPAPVFPPEKKCNETIENTKVDDDSICPRILGEYIDIDSYSNSQNFDSTKY